MALFDTILHEKFRELLGIPREATLACPIFSTCPHPLEEAKDLLSDFLAALRDKMFWS